MRNNNLETRFASSSCHPQKLYWMRPRAGGWCDCSGVSRGGAQGDRPPPLFLDQTEAQRPEKKIFGDRAPSLSQDLDYQPPTFLKVWISHWIDTRGGGVL